MSLSPGRPAPATATADPDPAVADDPGAVAPVRPATFKRGREQGLVVLLVTPVLIALGAFLLWNYVTSADQSRTEQRSLDWSTRLWPQLTTHVSLTLWSTVLVLAIAIPLGIALTRPLFRRGGPFVLSVANIGQAIPAYGLFILFFTWRGQGFRTAVLALVVFALLPVLRNTMVGIQQVDPAVIEAGRGMGMSRLRALLRIELPLAVPVILAGIRTALVINVGMASLAFLIGGGGLGITIYRGLQLRRDLIAVTGAAMVALLALTVDWIAAVVERALRPKGL